jgi:hypothetical protein
LPGQRQVFQPLLMVFIEFDDSFFGSPGLLGGDSGSGFNAAASECDRDKGKRKRKQACCLHGSVPFLEDGNGDVEIQDWSELAGAGGVGL